VADKDIRMLAEAIVDYLQWEKSMKKDHPHRCVNAYSLTLIEFLRFAISRDIPWKDLFTLNTVKEFSQSSPFRNASSTLITLSRYLSIHGRIPEPIILSKRSIHLPDLFEQYLQRQSHKVCPLHIRGIRHVLVLFHGYLEKQGLALPKLTIEHLDHFLAQLNVAQITRKIYQSLLRGFLNYLHQEQRVLKKDLGSMLTGPRLFSQQKPPKFLRPQEVQRLFASLSLSTQVEIRTCALIHLAYTLGLRPVEISRITLEDISPKKAEITLPHRKGHNPITLPLPENTLKAIAAYLSRGRPRSPSRTLFVSLQFPYGPMHPSRLSQSISTAMRRAGLSATAYCLRHTYAQNLLQMGHSIYEIKEMLGHDRVHSTQRYLYIHVDLMREVLFHETL